MALATQCPHCGTSFRVGAEQLTLRKGLVRCGTCSRVFDGQEHLLSPAEPAPPPPLSSLPVAEPPGIHLDLPEEEPPSLPLAADGQALPLASSPVPEPGLPEPEAHSPGPAEPPSSVEARPALLRHPSDERVVPGAGTASAFPEADPSDRHSDPLQYGGLLRASHAEEEAPPSAPFPPHQPEPPLFTAPRHRAGPFRSGWQKPLPPLVPRPSGMTVEQPERLAAAGDREPPWQQDPPRSWRQHRQSSPAAASAWPAQQTPGADAGTRPAPQPSPEQEPDFVRSARRRQRLAQALPWALGLALPLLILAALLQVLHAFPDRIAGRWPWAAPTVAQACALFGCPTELPMRINAITIEASELQALAAGEDTFALTVWLHNGSAARQAWPHLELTLNDFEEQALVRRVFSPAEYLPSALAASPDTGLAAGAQHTVRLLFALPALQAAGYRVYLFYP